MKTFLLPSLLSWLILSPLNVFGYSTFTQENPGLLPKEFAVKLISESKNLKFIKENASENVLYFKNSKQELCVIKATITKEGYFIPLSVEIDLDSGKSNGALFVAVDCK